jgi:hypothetical protein
MDGKPIPDNVAHSLIRQANTLLSSVQAYADGL